MSYSMGGQWRTRRKKAPYIGCSRCVCVCVRACVHACVCACMCACMHMCVHVSLYMSIIIIIMCTHLCMCDVKWRNKDSIHLSRNYSYWESYY